MKRRTKQLLLLEDDYRLLLSYIKGGSSKYNFDVNNASALMKELEKAMVVKRKDFPPDVVRINSHVRLQSDDTNNSIEITVVTPDKANIKEKKVSVMAPVGTALLGFREGQQVNWWVPAGHRTFRIIQVTNISKETQVA